jgi:hypothetical protein
MMGSEAAKKAWETRRRNAFRIEALNLDFIPDLLAAVEALSGELRAFGPTDDAADDAAVSVNACFKLVVGRRPKRRGKKRDWK